MTDRVRSMTSFAACTDGAAEACGCELPCAIIEPSQSADGNLWRKRCPGLLLKIDRSQEERYVVSYQPALRPSIFGCDIWTAFFNWTQKLYSTLRTPKFCIAMKHSVSNGRWWHVRKEVQCTYLVYVTSIAVTDVIPVSASASWFKWAKGESENVPVKELLLKLAELDCFWVQSFREYTNQVRAHNLHVELRWATLSCGHL